MRWVSAHSSKDGPGSKDGQGSKDGWAGKALLIWHAGLTGAHAGRSAAIDADPQWARAAAVIGSATYARWKVGGQERAVALLGSAVHS